MTLIEELEKTRLPIDDVFISDILRGIIDSKELNNSSLQSVLTCHRRGDAPDKNTIIEFNHAIEDFLYAAITTEEPVYAAKLIGSDDLTVFERINKQGGTANDFEEKAYLDLIDILCSRAKHDNNSGRKYWLLNSGLLFPEVPELKEIPKYEYKLTINTLENNYVFMIRDIFDELVRQRIPFNIEFRDISDLHYGFADPIQIYTSKERLEDVSKIVSYVCKKYKNSIIKPEELLYYNKDNLYGVSPIKNGLSPMEAIISCVEDTINEEIVVDGKDWNEKRRIISKFNSEKRSSDRYNDLVRKIAENIIFSKNEFDSNNAYVYEPSKPVEEKVESTPTPVQKEDDYDYSESNGYDPIDEKDFFAPLNGNNEEFINSLNRHNVEEPKVEEQPQEEVQENVTEEPTNVVEESVQEEVKEEVKKPTSGPIFPDITKKEEEVEEESEPVLENTGAYTKNDIEVEGLSKEEKASDEKLDWAYTVDIQELFDKYIRVFGRFGTEPIHPVIIDKSGKEVEIVRYLEAQGASKLIDKQIETTEALDNKVMSGAEYIRSIVVPKFMENTVDNIYTLEQLNNMYVNQVTHKVADKRGLFSGLKDIFTKKKNR